MGALEQGVLQDPLHPAQRLDHVSPVLVEVPQLAVVPGVCPPEGEGPADREHLEEHPHPPALVVGQGVPVLLEEGVDPGDAEVPRVLEVLQGDPEIRVNSAI